MEIYGSSSRLFGSSGPGLVSGGVVAADTVLPAELEPVALPEFGGLKVGFAMCLNRMCPNLGQHWGTEPGSDGRTDSRQGSGVSRPVLARGDVLGVQRCVDAPEP